MLYGCHVFGNSTKMASGETLFSITALQLQDTLVITYFIYFI